MVSDEIAIKRLLEIKVDVIMDSQGVEPYLVNVNYYVSSLVVMVNRI